MQPLRVLSHEAIAEFKRIYEEEFGVALEDDEATAMATRVLRLFQILSQSHETAE